MAWAITGALIVSRQPRNSAGWIFCIGAVSITLNVSALVYVVYSVRIASNPLPGQDFVALIGEYSFALVALIPLLVLLFPDGRPPSPRWRWATWTLLVGFGLSVVAFALTPGPLNNLVEDGILYANPFGLSPFADGRPANALVGIGVFMMLGASLATVVAAWQRFRRARGEERQQMRWLVATATLAGLGIGGILLLFPVGLLLGTTEESFPEWLWVVFFLPTALAIFVGIPAAYLVAIFKHGLWDLDVVIKKALVALVLTLLIAGVGVVAIAVLGRSALWEGDRTGALIGILAGLAIWPLVGFSRRIAKRVVFGRRAAPYQVLTEFSGRVGGTYATEDVLPRMAQILGQGTGAENARVWLHVGGTLRPEAAWPANAAAREPVPLSGDELSTIDGESDVTDALENVRNLARGIYPPVLADHGLAAALEAQARKALDHGALGRQRLGPIPVGDRGRGVLLLSRGDAEHREVRERERRDRSVWSGRTATSRSRWSTTVAGSIPRAAGGSGLTNMRDRVEAVGGTLEIQSEPGIGTSVTGRVRSPR